MVRRYHDLGLVRVRYQVHRTAHALENLAGDHVVGQVTRCRDLQGAEDRHVDVAATDHAEGLAAVESSGTWEEGDCLLASIDDIAKWKKKKKNQN